MKYTNFGGLRLTLWSVVSRLIIQGHDRESVLEMFMSSDGFPRHLKEETTIDESSEAAFTL